jgi:hypothetical protein
LAAAAGTAEEPVKAWVAVVGR